MPRLGQCQLGHRWVSSPASVRDRQRKIFSSTARENCVVFADQITSVRICLACLSTLRAVLSSALMADGSPAPAQEKVRVPKGMLHSYVSSEIMTDSDEHVKLASA